MKKFAPSADPALIDVPGLDPNAPYEDQIELLDQLITLKLQARIYSHRCKVGTTLTTASYLGNRRTLGRDSQYHY